MKKLQAKLVYSNVFAIQNELEHGNPFYYYCIFQ